MSLGQRGPDGHAVTLPPLDERIALSWPDCGGAMSSRVEDHGADRFAVLAPLPPVGVPDPVPGSNLTVAWPTPRGVHRLPSTLLSSETSGGVLLWWLTPTGALSVVQRREFVRVPASVIVRLEGPLGPVAGASVDISEGGLAVRLSKDDVDPWELSAVTVPVDDRSLVATIRVVRAGRDPGSGRWSLGAGFVELPPGAEDHLRRHVYLRQVALRRIASRAR